MTEWTFTLEPADDDTVDSQWILDQNPRFTIQDCRAYQGGLVVVEHAPEETPPEDLWVIHHGEHQILDAAKAECIQRADRAALAAEYLAKIGYDPFEDDPTIDPDIVRHTLKEHDEIAAGDPPHDDTDWMGIHHGRNA